MRSKFVHQEWDHALSLNRRNFVRPVYWEIPLPEDKEAGLPPEKLRQLQFHLIGSGVTQPPVLGKVQTAPNERATPISEPTMSKERHLDPCPNGAAEKAVPVRAKSRLSFFHLLGILTPIVVLGLFIAGFFGQGIRSVYEKATCSMSGTVTTSADSATSEGIRNGMTDFPETMAKTTNSQNIANGPTNVLPSQDKPEGPTDVFFTRDKQWCAFAICAFGLLTVLTLKIRSRR